MAVESNMSLLLGFMIEFQELLWSDMRNVALFVTSTKFYLEYFQLKNVSVASAIKINKSKKV